MWSLWLLRRFSSAAAAAAVAVAAAASGDDDGDMRLRKGPKLSVSHGRHCIAVCRMLVPTIPDLQKEMMVGQDQPLSIIIRSSGSTDELVGFVEHRAVRSTSNHNAGPDSR